MTRNERLLRLARLRGDRAAVAILEGGRKADRHPRIVPGAFIAWIGAPGEEWTEAELRAAWGDR